MPTSYFLTDWYQLHGGLAPSSHAPASTARSTASEVNQDGHACSRALSNANLSKDKFTHGSLRLLVSQGAPPGGDSGSSWPCSRALSIVNLSKVKFTHGFLAVVATYY
eukprot:TRINITY_DN6270_c0_g2_i1.p1 TRINITY_DN6270_c0_g2~~TRINITY_DN6270_c0_g2_i1.p1  ORF type:complete len:108 (+),score=4.10 TRINITY_DN6270_c0_g2_i1:740-1063(+)